MKLSPGQERARDAVYHWYSDSSEQVFKLFGYAGTGKTTITKMIVEGLGVDVVYGAYTGKAAYVMNNAGCEGATTLHSLIYMPKEKSQSRLRELQLLLDELKQQDPPPTDRIAKGVKMIEEERKNLRRPMFTLKLDSPISACDLLVVDECSMVDEQMGRDLLSFGTKILVLGDPAQLPPVRGGGFFTKGRPDAMLTEIHRQARDNPIVDMATRVRQGERLDYGRFGTSKVIHKSEITPEDAESSDQILVWTNKTRLACNRRCRELRGRHGHLPNVGERLVCLKNNHEKGLLNGAIYTVDESGVQDGNIVPMQLRDEAGGDKVVVEAHVAPFEGRETPHWDIRDTDQFDYGYALTCHKSQGSQWGRVLVFDEFRGGRSEHDRWLYTAITRASESVTVVR